MSAAAPQPSPKPVPKVLRIGIALEQKIVQERLMKIGEAVTVGENPRNSFVVTGTKLPQRFEMFVARGDAYSLVVPEWVEGKISWRDGIRGLDELRQRGEAVKRGDLYHIPLNENVRGKVTIGSATLLFQFVPAPPEPVRASSPADYKARWFDDEDPLFQGLLGVFSLVAGAFMLWVYVTPVTEHLDLDALEDAAKLVVVKPIDLIEIPVEAPSEEAEAEKPAEEKKVAEEKVDAAPSEPKAVTKESVAKKSLLLQMLGTTGNANGQAVDDILGDDAAAMRGLDDALNGVSGVQEASASGMAAKGGTAGGKEDAKVGVGIATGGSASTGSGAATKIKKPIVESGEADADVSEGDAGGIASVVKKSQGRVVSCLDQALKQNQSLNGKVSVGWSIQAGRVSDAHIVKNTTGDTALGECVARAVRGFRFDESLTAEVAEFPWVVSGQ